MSQYELSDAVTGKLSRLGQVQRLMHQVVRNNGRPSHHALQQHHDQTAQHLFVLFYHLPHQLQHRTVVS